MHIGPSPQTHPSAPCCGGRVHVVSLTRDETPGATVELIRCSDCGENTWRLDGVDVAKDDALAALSTAFTSTAPKPRLTRTQPKPAALVSETPDLAALLTGWQVLGEG